MRELRDERRLLRAHGSKSCRRALRTRALVLQDHDHRLVGTACALGGRCGQGSKARHRRGRYESRKGHHGGGGCDSALEMTRTALLMTMTHHRLPIGSANWPCEIGSANWPCEIGSGKTLHLR